RRGGGRKPVNGDVNRIFRAFERVVFRVNRLLEALSVLKNDIFGNNQIAGAGDREVRLSGDDQTESLEVGGYVNFGFAGIVRNNFPEVDGAAFGGDGPENV